ncbi:ATP-dependent helicase [Candidatus Pacearchaeota archaeon]|nr:ATP-dependent helicase [Candidatus Pacearchaeota archaeon]
METYLSKTQGPCAILAGAGTGKTRSIIEKLKYIINNKPFSIENVVCLTFSNEAVNNLKERIIPHLKNKEPIIATFHSFCADILRAHGEKIKIKQNFKIITPDDGKILLHKYFKTLPILCNKYIDEIGTKKDLGETIENYEKNERTSEQIQNLSRELEESKFKINTNHINKLSKEQIDTIKQKRDDLEEQIKQAKFIQAWKSYEKIKQSQSGLDYSDLHHKALELLTKHPEITNQFDYVIVDEFQDTNKIQCDLLEKIAIKKNITVVGDLNQSIYRFRGAYQDNFNYFKQKFQVKNDNIFKLEKSYRSTNKILNIAHELIQNNYENKEDCFKVRNAHNFEGEKIRLFELKNSKEEVRKIIEIIREEIQKNTPLNKVCVIFRTHQQSNLLKKQLEYEQIPFTSVNKESLLKDKKIKLIRAYLTITDKIHNKSKGGEGAIWEIVNQSVTDQKDNFTITKDIQKIKESECITNEFMNKEFQIQESSQLQINSAKKIINQLLEIKEKKAHEIVKKLYEILNIEDKNSIPLLEKFHTFVKDLPESDSDLTGLIYHLNTIDSLNINVEAPELVKDGIRIMTNHATKGLEYDIVIMSSMVQKKFPIERIDEGDNLKNQIAEERRLCYVGFTRARYKLFLTYAKEYGQRKFDVSQFLNEISYQNNLDIEFIIDNEEKYKEPEPEIKQANQLEETYISFSPSSLQLFDECQKRYEMKYIYNMPDPTPQSWEAITLGSFIHRVLEEAVKQKIKTQKEIEDLAKIMQLEEYNELNLEEALPMIRVFLERNKKFYNENSQVEVHLKSRINNITFTGYADRIDISDTGDLTIIDYKTGKYDVKPRYRNWQLGIYALASKDLGKPKRLILDMLQKETPLIFEINSQGIAKEIHSPRTYFDLEEVKKEIVETAQSIMQARRLGFRSCATEKNCDFCQNLK